MNRNVLKEMKILCLLCLIVLSALPAYADGLTVGATGRVGIGTETPEAKLDIKINTINDCILFESSTGYLKITPGNTDTGSFNSLTQNGDHGIFFSDGVIDTGDLIIGPVASSPKGIKITSDGNVGIGNATPEAKLSFPNLNLAEDADGITWYSPNPLSFGLYRTSGPWVTPNYQQLKMQWDSGIIIDGGSCCGKSGVWLQPNGGRGVGIHRQPTHYSLDVNGTARVTTLIQTSDRRLKENIQPIRESLDKLSQIHGVSYELKNMIQKKEVSAQTDKTATKRPKNRKTRLGLIAQEVEQVFPEAVYTDEDGMKAIAYSQLIGPLIESVKELKVQNANLIKRIERLESNSD